MTLTWEEPEENTQESLFTQAVQAQLKATPGEWARIAIASRSLRTKWRKNYPGFEFTTRKVEGEPEGRAKIYARWVGDS